MFDFGERPDTSKPPRRQDTPPDLDVSDAVRFVQNDLQLSEDDAEVVLRKFLSNRQTRTPYVPFNYQSVVPRNTNGQGRNTTSPDANKRWQ